MNKIARELMDGRVMRAELDEKSAPLTVANFLKLVDENFFAGLIFHRVIKNFMIQGGGMYQNLEEKHTSAIKGEFIQNGVNNPIKHNVGTLSMARTMDPNSASSQFFICVAPCSYLDGQYAAFGKLCDEESEKIAIDISSVQTTSFRWYDDVPLQPIVIKTIKRI